MDGMDMSSSSMSSTSMVFTTDHSTPLFSSQWTPSTPAAYAGTCIFLIALAVISRLLSAWRQMLEAQWRARAAHRRYVVLAGETAADRERQISAPADPNGDDAEKSDEATLTVRGLDERVRVLRSPRQAGVGAHPWRLSVDLPRAAVHVVWAGVGYLLMLAVMTLNVGYVLSVLAGLFVGELAVGRYAQLDHGHH